jgi:3-deoxy-D-manno-octulosonic-acid transferase
VFFYWLYRVIGFFLTPFVLVFGYFRLSRGKELNIENRWGISTIDRPIGSVVWVHAASVGEAVSAIPVIEQICEHRPKAWVLLTTSTASASKVIRSRLPTRCVHQFVPFDMNRWVQRFLDFWTPSLLILIESDFWPNLICQTAKRKIPIYYLNARISRHSYARWRKIKPLFQFLFQYIRQCYAESIRAQALFGLLGVHSIKLMANLKFFAPPLPIDTLFLQSLRERIGRRPFWVMASTHPGEEELAFQTLQWIRKTHPDCLLILAPRHINRTQSIMEIAQLMQFHPVKRSDAPEQIRDIFVLDTLGELGSVYALKSIVVMGGSFFPNVGGHNPIEPILMGCTVAWGAHMEYYSGILPKIHAIEAVTLYSMMDLCEFLQNALQNPESFQALAVRMKSSIIEIREGVSDIIQTILRQSLPNASSEKMTP